MFVIIKRAGNSGWHLRWFIISRSLHNPFSQLHALSGHCRVWNGSFATVYATGPTRCLHCVGVGQMFHWSSQGPRGMWFQPPLLVQKNTSIQNQSTFRSEPASHFVLTSLSVMFIHWGEMWKRTLAGRSASIDNLIWQEEHLQGRPNTSSDFTWGSCRFSHG